MLFISRSRFGKFGVVCAQTFPKGHIACRGVSRKCFPDRSLWENGNIQVSSDAIVRADFRCVARSEVQNEGMAVIALRKGW